MGFAGLLLTSAILLIVIIQPAYAYLDPGTGSMVIQVLIAVVLGAGYTVKVFWKRIIAFLRRLFRKDAPGQ